MFLTSVEVIISVNALIQSIKNLMGKGAHARVEKKGDARNTWTNITKARQPLSRALKRDGKAIYKHI